MIKVYFVRHAQPEPSWKDDRTKPLTAEGMEDTKTVLAFLRDKQVDEFYCSPYKRSIDTIAETATFYGKTIHRDERLREREKGEMSNLPGMYQKRWADLHYHEEGGESIAMVQERNMEALKDILKSNPNKTIVIGTHGTALSSILRYYDETYNCDSFLRIKNWMPYILEVDFQDEKIIHKKERVHVEK